MSPTNVNKIMADISALTAHIRNSLPKSGRSLFDIKEKVKASQTFSKVPGQDLENKQAEFLEKKMDGILKEFKKDSIQRLKNKKEELEGLRTLAEKTLGGNTQQGRGIYEQYALIAKGLNDELKSRQQLGNKIGSFLKRNQIDAISITAALTTRNPVIGLGIKYLLEQRKASKEAAAEGKHNSILNSINYRNYLQHLLQLANKPRYGGPGGPGGGRRPRGTPWWQTPMGTTPPGGPGGPGGGGLSPGGPGGGGLSPGNGRKPKGTPWWQTPMGYTPPGGNEPIDAEYEDLGNTSSNRPPLMLNSHVYEMPPISPKQDAKGKWHDEKGRYTSAPKPQTQSPEIAILEKPLEDLRIVAVKISNEIEKFHDQDKEKTDAELDAEEEKKEADEKRNQELINSIKLLGPGKSTGKKLIPVKKGGGFLKTLEKGAGEGLGMKFASSGLGLLLSPLSKLFGFGGGAAAGGGAAGGAAAGGGAAGGAAAGGGAAGGGAATGGAIAGGAGASVAMIGASLLLLAVDAVMGVFKAKKWGTSKTSAGLGGMMGGSLKNQMLNTFTQMGKWALIGATIGSIVPGIGTLAGGLLGAALGEIMGFIGGEKIANFMEKSGIGRFFSSLGNMLYVICIKPLIRIFKVAKIGMKFLIEAFEFVNKTFIQPVLGIIKTTLAPLLDPLEKKLKQFFDFFSNIFDWISKVSDDSDMDKMVDDILSNQGDVFGNIMKSFQQGFLNFAAGLLEMVPDIFPGSGALHDLAKSLREQSNAMDNQIGPIGTLEYHPITNKENKPSPVVGQPITNTGSNTPNIQAFPNISNAPEKMAYNVNSMNMSKKGMELLKTNESFRSEPYPDAGHMSIGYGHQIQPGENLTHIDEKTANELLQQDVKKAENLVKNNIKVPLLQNQFDGLVDFAYNMPGGISSIAQNVNRGDIPGAAERMKLYNKSKEKGKLIVNQGLIGRRNTESAEFLGITPESTATALKPPAPQTGRGILDATKHNEDIKAQQANNQNGNTIVAPTTNNSTTTAHLSMPQQDPQNTDNTFRDARHRNQFGG